jgi:hypothetical protein
MCLSVRGRRNPLEDHGADPHPPVGNVGFEREQSRVADVPLAVDVRDQQPRVRASSDACYAELVCLGEAGQQRPTLGILRRPSFATRSATPVRFAGEITHPPPNLRRTAASTQVCALRPAAQKTRGSARLIEDLVEKVRDDPGGHSGGRAGWVTHRIELEDVEPDHATASRYFNQDRAQLPIAAPPGSGSECPGAIEESSTSRSIET